MEDGLFLQTAEGLRDSCFTGTDDKTWNCLRDLKEEVSQDLLEEGPLCQTEAGGLQENETSVANVCDIEWNHRA